MYNFIMKKCKISGCESPDLASRSAMCKTHHRDYVRQHYADNKQYYIDKANRHYKDNIQVIKDAKSIPCMDCGVQYPYYVMDFDHREDKKFNIGGQGKKKGKGQILEEISKCDVVCSNCHRERTARRAGYQTELILDIGV